MKFQTSCRDCLKYFQFQTKFYVVSDKTVLVWNGHRLVQVGSLDRKPEFGEPTSLDVWSNDNRAVVFVFYKVRKRKYNITRCKCHFALKQVA